MHLHNHDVRDKTVNEQKIAEVAKLVSGVAHHINNPVGSVKDNMATLLQYIDTLLEGSERLVSLLESSSSGALPDDQDIQEVFRWFMKLKVDDIRRDIKPLLSSTMEGVDHISSVLQRLLIVDQVVKYANSRMIDLNKLLKSIDYSAAGSIPEKITINSHLTSYPLLVYGKVEQLRIAIGNVLNNAVDAAGEPGNITITTELDGGWASLDIHDSGEGIPAAVMSCIFEPFFSTKESEHRIGLEMTISRHIIQAHGGLMNIQSHEGQGTCVSIRLPLHDLN
jgi:signal transduction histidine kinase